MNKTFRNIIFFFFAVLIGKFIGSFTTAFVAKFLSTANYGIWVTLILIGSYAPIICLGTVETLLKQFPYFTAKSEFIKAKEVEDGVFSSIVMSSALLIVIGFIGCYILKDEVAINLLLIRTMLIAAALSLFSAFFYQRFASYQNFKIVSLIDSSRAFSTFILLVSFSWLWGLKGIVFGYFINELIICIFSGVLSVRICGNIGTNFNLKLLWNLIKIGFPITIIWWVFLIQTSAGRIISMSMLGATATGYFGLGVSVSSLITLIPQVIGTVLYPKVNEKIGMGATTDELHSVVILPARLFSLIIPFLLGIFFLLIPLLFTFVFPQYMNGIDAAQILLLGVFFVCILRSGVNYLIGMNEQGSLLKYFLASLLVNIAVTAFLINANLYVNGVAIGTGLSQALLSTLIWRDVFKKMGFKTSEQFREIFKLYLPMLLVILIMSSIKLILNFVVSQSEILPISLLTIFIMLFPIIILRVAHLHDWSKELYAFLKIKMKRKRPQFSPLS